MTLISILYIKDINECNGDHECDQLCNNIVGSYICSCDSGYELQSDNRSCEGLLLMHYISTINT